jgi:hypothetical protein
MIIKNYFYKIQICIIPYYKNESYKKEYETFKPKNKIILLQELINNHFQKIHDLIN